MTCMDRSEGEGRGEDETHLLDLPDHVIVENILAELVPSSLLGNVAKIKDLRDMLSVASTCTRIHTLASHPSLWRNVNAGTFYARFRDAIERGLSPPLLPLGAVHCGVLVVSDGVSAAYVALLESLRDLTVVRANLADSTAGDLNGRLVGAVSSLRRLARLELYSGPTLRLFTGVPLPRSLDSLAIGGRSIELVGFFSSAVSFPSLTTIVLWVEFDSPTDVIAAIASKCRSLVRATIRGNVSGSDIHSLATACRSLRRLTISTNESVTTVGIRELTVVRNLRKLWLHAKGHVSARFIALFPELKHLEFKEHLPDSADDLSLIASIPRLEHLSMYREYPEKFLAPLVKHPSTPGRQSLVKLHLSGFAGADIGGFLASPWCSQLVELELRGCVVTSSALADVAAAHGRTLSTTLRDLGILGGETCDGGTLGAFIAALSSLRKLKVVSWMSGFDTNGLLRAIGSGSSARLLKFKLDVNHDEGRLIDVGPVLHLLSGATGITIGGIVDQCTVDSVASSCPDLRFLSVQSHSVLSRPASLANGCTFEPTTIDDEVSFHDGSN